MLARVYSVKIGVIFGVRLERRKVDKKSKPTWKMKHANSILGTFEYFCQKVIKIDHYNSELYRFKIGAFFETQCRKCKYELSIDTKIDDLG